MRILLINYEFPPLGGGAGNSTMHIAKSYAKRGHEVLVLTTWFEGLEREEQEGSLKVVRVRSLRKRKDRSNPLEMLDYVRQALKEKERVMNFKPDFSIGFMALPSGIPAYYYKKKYDIPYVLSIQGGDVPGFLPNEKLLTLYHHVSAPLTELVWKQAFKIVANSEGLMHLAQKTGNKIGKEIVSFPNGVDTEYFRPGAATNKGVPVKLLFVGRFSRQKGLDDLMKVAALLKERCPKNSFVLELVGDGPEKPMLEKMIHEYDLRKLVRLSPWCSKDELLTKYQGADIFLLTSHEEGMPNVLSEAMACGLPVVSTLVRGCDELIEDGRNGYLTEPGNVEQFAEKVHELIRDSQKREAFSKCGLKKTSNYSWDAVGEFYIEAFNDAKKKKRI